MNRYPSRARGTSSAGRSWGGRASNRGGAAHRGRGGRGYRGTEARQRGGRPQGETRLPVEDSVPLVWKNRARAVRRTTRSGDTEGDGPPVDDESEDRRSAPTACGSVPKTTPPTNWTRYGFIAKGSVFTSQDGGQASGNDATLDPTAIERELHQANARFIRHPRIVPLGCGRKRRADRSGVEAAGPACPTAPDVPAETDFSSYAPARTSPAAVAVPKAVVPGSEASFPPEATPCLLRATYPVDALRVVASERGPQGPGENGSQVPGEGGSQGPGESRPQGPGEGGSQGPGENGSQVPGERGPHIAGESRPQGPVEGGSQGPGENGSRLPRENGSPVPGERGPQKTRNPQPAETPLWTEKYRPTRCAELLGNGRSVAALANWVAARKRRERSDDVPLAALLTGPAGVGKTSAAHACLRDQGYAIFEVNASDTRNPETLVTLVRQAATRRTLTGPSAVVVDEIDGGIPGENGTVAALVRFLAKADASLAPIICIANDRSSPGVLSLVDPKGAGALDLKFFRLFDSDLRRLFERIAVAQGLALEPWELQTLLDTVNGDARLLVTALQVHCRDRRGSMALKRVMGHKDRSENSWDAAAHVLYSRTLSAEHACAFCEADPFRMRALIHENYPTVLRPPAVGWPQADQHLEGPETVGPEVLDAMFHVADTLSLASLIEQGRCYAGGRAYMISRVVGLHRNPKNDFVFRQGVRRPDVQKSRLPTKALGEASTQRVTGWANRFGRCPFEDLALFQEVLARMVASCDRRSASGNDDAALRERVVEAFVCYDLDLDALALFRRLKRKRGGNDDEAHPTEAGPVDDLLTRAIRAHRESLREKNGDDASHVGDLEELDESIGEPASSADARTGTPSPRYASLDAFAGRTTRHRPPPPVRGAHTGSVPSRGGRGRAAWAHRGTNKWNGV